MTKVIWIIGKRAEKLVVLDHGDEKVFHQASKDRVVYGQ
jgi:hypothetical protein